MNTQYRGFSIKISYDRNSQTYSVQVEKNGICIYTADSHESQEFALADAKNRIDVEIYMNTLR